MAINLETFRRLDPQSAEHRRYADHDGLPAVRRAVIRELGHRLNALVEPLGYRRESNEWRKATRWARTLVLINRDPFGFACGIGVAARSRFGSTGEAGAATPDGFVLLPAARFYPDLPADCDVDWLPYRRLSEDAAAMPALLDLFRLRMCPWLEEKHRMSAILRASPPEEMKSIKVL